MFPHDPNHYKFIRNSHFKRSDFEHEDNPPTLGNKLVFFACFTFLLLILTGAI
jgi:hypothetical protein